MNCAAQGPGRAWRSALRFLLFLLLGWLGSAGAFAQSSSAHISASLLTSTERPRPGETFLVGLRLTPQKGWHSYWSNPGESGLAPTVEWQSPDGLSFGPLQHPAPTLLKVLGITSYVHAGEHILLSRVRLNSSVATGTQLPVEARVNWLECSESLCVPGRATLSLNLAAGNGARSRSASALGAAERRLPRQVAQGTFYFDQERIRLRLPVGIKIDPTSARFFPDRNGVLDAAAARVRTIEGITEIDVPAQAVVSGTISGVLSDGPSAYYLKFRKADRPAPAAVPIISSEERTSVQAEAGLEQASRNGPAGRTSVPMDSPEISASPSVLVAIFAAVLGGLLLNLMPCVFPVLSIKALALARAGTSKRDARVGALAYTAGSVISCAALGLVIMGLRLAGQDVGWSFQLQHRGVTLALALLATAITLNLAGVFELPGLSFSGAPTRESRAASSLGAGALTAFVATPCSGPFMATALGATLAFPPVMAIVIYAGLGFGLALPMLLIAFLPGLRRSLPKPGPWMRKFQRSMAVPTGLAALALIWLLTRQADRPAFLKGTALVLLFSLLLWWWGARQKSGVQRRWLGLIPTTAAIAGLGLVWPAPVAVNARATGLTVQEFSDARLVQLRRAGVPVFVDITADWCLTCKINERLAIDRPETRAAFNEAGIVTLRGDWTNGDPAITRFLASHRRNSIPFYLFYGEGKPPMVLPQLLSVSALRNLGRAQPVPRMGGASQGVRR